MIGMYRDKVLSYKTILQNFLMEFHLRQGNRLRTMPKILLDRNWGNSAQIFVSFMSQKGRDKCIDQYRHEVIIPFTDVIIDKLYTKMGDCDVLVFHKLPIPKCVTGYVETLDGVSARIVTGIDWGMCPSEIARLDIGFTPMWLKREDKNRLWYVDQR